MLGLSLKISTHDWLWIQLWVPRPGPFLQVSSKLSETKTGSWQHCLVLSPELAHYFLCVWVSYWMDKGGFSFFLLNALVCVYSWTWGWNLFLSPHLSLLAPYLDFYWILHFVNEMCHSPFGLFSLSLFLPLYCLPNTHINSLPKHPTRPPHTVWCSTQAVCLLEGFFGGEKVQWDARKKGFSGQLHQMIKSLPFDWLEKERGWWAQWWVTLRYPSEDGSWTGHGHWLAIPHFSGLWSPPASLENPSDLHEKEKSLFLHFVVVLLFFFSSTLELSETF